MSINESGIHVDSSREKIFTLCCKFAAVEAVSYSPSRRRGQFQVADRAELAQVGSGVSGWDVAGRL